MDEQDKPTIIVAMGGHAFIKPGEKGSIRDHERNAEAICGYLMYLVEKDYNIVITHGNGPQVGALLLKNELTRDQVPPMPLDVLVANTEGSLGYMMQQSMLNQLRRRNIQRYVVTVITQVLIDDKDPAFCKPTKPIGPFLSQEEAEKRAQDLGWDIVEDSGRGWRRVVPSPYPIKVIQHRTIKEAAANGHIVIACGGGGIPIMKNANNDYQGMEAVIDKDFTSSILATEINADILIILSDVPQVYKNYNTPNQRALGALTIYELEQLIKEGHFPVGSMGPKVEAILQFLKKGGKRGVITSPDNLANALEGKGGTHFVGRC